MLIHGDKPLGRGAINNRRLMAPAVWVGVGKGSMTQQPVASPQFLNDLVVRFEDVLTFEHRRPFQVDAITTNRIVDLKVVSLSNLKIFQTVRRCCVNTACSRISGHVITKH